jgi:hypothetical protein
MCFLHVRGFGVAYSNLLPYSQNKVKVHVSDFTVKKKHMAVEQSIGMSDRW